MLVLCLYHCTVCTVLVPLVQCSGMASTGNVPSYPRLYSYCICTVAQCVLCLYPLYSDSAWPARAIYPFLKKKCPCLYSYCDCTVAQCVLRLYLLYSGLAWPARVMYILPVFALVLCVYYCTVCTVLVPLVQWFSMASTGRVSIGPCLYSYCGCTIAQCVLCVYLLYSGLAWPARVMYILPFLYSYCACTIAQCILCVYPLYSVLAWPARAVYLLARVCTRTVVLYHCTVCTVLVPIVQWSGMASTGNVHFTRFCTRTVRVLLHSVYCTCTPCTVV